MGERACVDPPWPRYQDAAHISCSYRRSSGGAQELSMFTVVAASLVSI
jgi:hypothetical protein